MATKNPTSKKVKTIPAKYLKLKADVMQALLAGEMAESKVRADGGSCNFDGTIIWLPRWNKKQVEDLLKPYCTEYGKFFGKTGAFYIHPNSSYQADKRSANAEAVTKYLERKGYDVFFYQQMD